MSRLESPDTHDDHVSTMPTDRKTNTPMMPDSAPVCRERHWLKAYRTQLASIPASMLATMAGFPFDSIKTRQQSSYYKNSVDCFKDAKKSDGVKGLFKGALAPTFSQSLVRTLSMSIYQSSKYSYSAAIGRITGGDEPLVIVNRPGSVPTWGTVACFAGAGATTALVASVIACPFELTKQASQTSTLLSKSTTPGVQDSIKKSYGGKGTIGIFKQIYINHGFLGFFAGLHLHLARDTIGTAIYFAVYESGKQLAVKFQGSDSPASPSAVAFAGGICGVASWTFVYPIDTAKTEYQRKCLLRSSGQEKIPKEKVLHFARNGYRGFGMSMCRTVVTGMAFFSVFEFVKKIVNNLEDPVIKHDSGSEGSTSCT